jgi:hypothetical protein
MPSTATNTILGSQTRQMQRREFHAIHPVNHPAGSFTTEQKSALAKGISRGIKDWKVRRRWFRSPAATTLRSPAITIFLIAVFSGSTLRFVVCAILPGDDSTTTSSVCRDAWSRH